MFDWIKVIHILAIVSWMAGLLYLPRILVYHCDAQPGGEADGFFKVMERRLLKAIMRPAAVVSLLSGGLLFWIGGFEFSAPWFHGKLMGVVLLLAFHGFMEKSVGEFAVDVRRRGARFFRVANEVPTVLLILIVTCVVVKPFQ